jgi:predicted aspartyl protease
MKHRLCLVAAAAALLSVPAPAADCDKLVSYGSIPLTQIQGDRREFVPVEIAGVSKLMMLDTGMPFTTMTSAAAHELNLKPTRTDVKLYDLTGAKTDQFVSAPLKIGNTRSSNIEFMLSPSSRDDFGDPRVAGAIGADILNKLDISIDFGAHTFTMFNQNHCEGQVVYWPERPLLVVPFKLQDGWQIILPVTLDGKEVKAALNTGAGTSTLEKGKAERSFDVVAGSTDSPVANDLIGAKGLTTWRHRFKSLSFAGIEVMNPEIHIIPDMIGEKRNNWSTGTMVDQKAHSTEQPPILLGVDVLRHLHIYIAYREKNLYISPAHERAATPSITEPEDAD